MKTIKIVSILTMLFSFSQCSSTMFVSSPPFTVEKAFYNNWAGGQPGVSGIKLEIHLKDASNVIFDALYFKGKKTKVEVRVVAGKSQLIGHFSTATRQNKDLILDIDSKNELDNTVPNLEKFPFKLKENEAVLSYKKGDKILFFKIEDIDEVDAMVFPSAKQK